MWLSTYTTSNTPAGRFPNTGKTPMEMIAEVPPIPVKGYVAICVGGGHPALGHPVEYIQLNKRVPGAIETCKYCGLRYFHQED